LNEKGYLFVSEKTGSNRKEKLTGGKMYTTNRSLYDRSLEKTPEQLFINSLRKEYELSPAESER